MIYYSDNILSKMEVLNDDLQLEIIVKMRYFDILELEQANKKYNILCNDNILWDKMMKRDFYFDDNILNSRKRYKHWLHYFNKHTKRIMSAFVLNNVRYDKLEQAYEEIFSLLVKYINLINIKDKGIVKQNWHCLDIIGDKMTEQDLENEYYIIHEIFVISGVTIEEHPEFIKLPPCLSPGYGRQVYHGNDIPKWTQLRHLIYDMINEYQEPQ